MKAVLISPEPPTSDLPPILRNRPNHQKEAPMYAARFQARRPGPVCIAAGLAIALLTAVACGRGDGAPGVAAPGDETFQKVTSLDTVYTFDDLLAAGFRESREYNVEGLTGATGAWFGWWRSAGADPVDIEVRFYPSHADAVEYGTPFAEEASGDNAIINSNDATWKEDVRDRRAVIGGVEGGGARSGAAAKYGDYVIFANMVILCEGTTSDHSMERCESLVDALRAPEGK